MITIATVFSPTLLGVFSCLTLGVAGVLFILARRGENGSIELNAPLSWADPVELRLVLYLILGAMLGVGALVVRLLLALVAVGSFAGGLLLAIVILCFLGNLAFFYAAMGSLLQGALGVRGRPPFWFSRFLGPVDGLIMDAGDILAGFLFRPAPPRARRARRPRREYYEEYDESERYDDEPAPVRRRRPVEASSPPVRRRPVYAEDEPQPRGGHEVPDETEDYSETGDEPERRAPLRRRRGSSARDIARERLLVAIEDYESTLTPSQREKLREMRGIVESIRLYP